MHLQSSLHKFMVHMHLVPYTQVSQQPSVLPPMPHPLLPSQAHKVYVQHLMQQHAEELHSLIAK